MILLHINVPQIISSPLYCPKTINRFSVLFNKPLNNCSSIHDTRVTLNPNHNYSAALLSPPLQAAAQWQLIIVITAHITTTHKSPYDAYVAVPRVLPSSCASLLAIKIGTEIQRLGIKFLVYYHHQHHPPTHYKYGTRIGWRTAHSPYRGRPI